jgi:hypothetical protein
MWRTKINARRATLTAALFVNNLFSLYRRNLISCADEAVLP